MSIEHLQKLLPEGFSDEARVWIFQSNRAFIENEQTEINEQLLQFYEQWQSHGLKVKGWAKILFAQFIVVIADERAHMVSGCSTDGMVRLIKSMERQYGVNFFERTLLTFLVNNKAEMLPMNQVNYAFSKAYISGDTPMFNNAVTTKRQLLTEWLIPIKHSWLGRKLRISEAGHN